MNETSLFAEALEINSDLERAAFLKKACGGDEKLQRRIEALLQANGRSDVILDATADLAKTGDFEPITEKAGSQIGPSNVLVTSHDGKPVAKVIDFGVAKAIYQQLTERTIYTQFAQMIGTPLYMSPEQAEMSGLDIDTRTDIYALGVLLYELFTGSTPLEQSRLVSAAYDEVRRMIREDEPLIGIAD